MKPVGVVKAYITKISYSFFTKNLGKLDVY